MDYGSLGAVRTTNPDSSPTAEGIAMNRLKGKEINDAQQLKQRRRSLSMEIQESYTAVINNVNNETGLESHKSSSNENFLGSDNYLNTHMLTGRQRKKLAARSKGSDFQQRRRKKRIYFCCVGNEIDLEALYDALEIDENNGYRWEGKMYEDVLHLCIPVKPLADTVDGFTSAGECETPTVNKNNDDMLNSPQRLQSHTSGTLYNENLKEVFIFAFGAAVFWNFYRQDEKKILNVIREYVVKGVLSEDEFKAGQDDMAFVTDAITDHISIANDVINLPEDSSAKSRLSLSFAIAQSAILAIFESRVDQKIYSYQYIPETLAAYGTVRLTASQLGSMIGDVYVIRHDVNLHTEILDTPDFFWKEDVAVEQVYHMTMKYLEMANRTDVLNKRVDMLRELLRVLQRQHENLHGVKLEWIIIWLILISLILEALLITVKLL
jgi:uncharacterized Rmd1/YagE family protein